MNNRYILIVMVALVPAIMWAGDYSHQSFVDQELKVRAAAGTAAQVKANIAAAEAVRSRNVQGILDARFDSKAVDKLFNPAANEPSFLNKLGNQLTIGIVVTCGTLIASIFVGLLAKKFLTPQSEQDKEATQATINEQTILKNLEADIERLEQGLPQLQKNLETEKDQKKAEFIKVVMSKGLELLASKRFMHQALSQEYDENQARRYAEQLQRNAIPKPAPAA